MRLIDADALLEELKKTYKYFDLKFYIEDAPTIESSGEYSKLLQTTLNGDLISREEAIEALEKNKSDWNNDYNKPIDRDIQTLSALPSADRPTLKQTDTLIIADALRYLIKDTERHELDRKRAEELREQILKYGASMCHSADRPKGEWIVENHEVVCSVCGQNNLETNFCPCCGADMRGEK